MGYARKDHHYRTVMRLTPEETVSPLAAPQVIIRVADLLP